MNTTTLPRAAQIEQALLDQFSPAFLNIVNESHMHHTQLPNPETHFNVTMVSKSFTNQTRVLRHQAVYHCLAALIEQGIHALSLHLYTPEEWESQQDKVTSSPRCLGGFHEQH